MGPINQALVKLFEADQKYRQAQSRYEAASRDVRSQERKVNELAATLDQTHLQLKELQARTANTELDIKAREQKIEHYREQQQTAKNNKEYQTFLIQINTEKVDKNKVEDELLRLMLQVERAQAEVKTLSEQFGGEKTRLGQMREQITGRLESLKHEVDGLKPARDQAAAEVPSKHLDSFERLADRFDGEALAPIEKPNRRVEEYVCMACNMSLSPDIYNRLHSRDEPLFCPSCHRFLFIPNDLPVELAVNQRKKPRKGEEKAVEPTASPEAPAIPPSSPPEVAQSAPLPAAQANQAQ
jgi:uncharacterized protein